VPDDVKFDNHKMESEIVSCYRNASFLDMRGGPQIHAR